jgi:hypothetical protein
MDGTTTPPALRPLEKVFGAIRLTITMRFASSTSRLNAQNVPTGSVINAAELTVDYTGGANARSATIDGGQFLKARVVADRNRVVQSAAQLL